VRPSSTARSDAHTAATSNSTNSASGLSYRKIATATGVSANTRPATRPAGSPNLRRTVFHTNATVTTPASACGSRMLHGLRPNSRTDNAMGHRDIGGLSTVMEFAASDDPNRNAFHDCEPAWAAAE
jgi:hypothetical protein